MRLTISEYGNSTILDILYVQDMPICTLQCSIPVVGPVHQCIFGVKERVMYYQSI